MTEAGEKLGPGGLPYRPGAGVVLVNDDGLIWAGLRIDSTVEAWQMPQGGIDKGEDPEKAAYRELYEETGMETVTLLGRSKGWINYDLPAELIGIGLKGKYRGQTQAWFAFRFTGDDSEFDLAAHGEPEFDAWRWGALEEAPDLIVPFKRDVYQQVVAAFEDLPKS